MVYGFGLDIWQTREDRGMTKVSLDSKMLSSVAYDEIENEMIVEFANGDEYKYKKVPMEVFDAMISAPSAGKYFLANVKNKFEYEKLD
jgi:hypothetical protein